MIKRVVFKPTMKVLTRIIRSKVKKTKGKTTETIIERETISSVETTIVITNTTGTNMVTKINKLGPMFHQVIGNLAIERLEVVCHALRLSCRRMIRSCNILVLFLLGHCPKETVSWSFHIPCTIDILHFPKVLCDLGASINLMM